MSAVLPFKESSRELIVEVAHALEPYFPDITVCWREKLSAELWLDGRALGALERLNVSTGGSYFNHGNFAGFFKNLGYFGNRLSKLQIDTRAVARSLELYQTLCEPYLGSLFGERLTEAKAALEMLAAATFQTVSAAYFDAKTGESAALLAVLDAELSAPDLSALLQRVLEITIATFGAANGVVLLRDPDSDLMQVSTSVGLEEPPADLTIAVGQGFSGRVAQMGEPDLVLDAAHDERIQSPALRRSASSIWAVPMKTAEATIGVLMIGFAKPYEWLPTERELLRAIADRSALAIDRARINDALREREIRIAELSAHLLRVQEQERRRISRELHDETGQELMVIRLYLDMLENTVKARSSRLKIRETLAVVDRTIDGIRRIIARLSPQLLQELGLIAAIRKEAKDLARNSGVKARVTVPEAIARMSPETEAAIYRVVQEALHNVAKHAQARSVNIQMTQENNELHLLIEDDGIGIQGKVSSSRGRSSAWPASRSGSGWWEARCTSVLPAAKARGSKSRFLPGTPTAADWRWQLRRNKVVGMPRIRCLLVDDHTLFRQGVRRLLEGEPDFEVVGESGDGGDAVEKARELRPDVVLMDIGMQGLSSFEAARHIRKNQPETKVLFLTMYEDEDYLVQSLEMGAAGYVLKDTPAPQLVTAVRDVYRGGKYLSSQVLGKLVGDFRAHVRDQRMRPRISTLTPREREILKLLAEGNSVKEIAVTLGLSVKTVEAHKFNLMRKLDIHNKAQLVTYAIQKKIIRIPMNQ